MLSVPVTNMGFRDTLEGEESDASASLTGEKGGGLALAVTNFEVIESDDRRVLVSCVSAADATQQVTCPDLTTNRPNATSSGCTILSPGI